MWGHHRWNRLDSLYRFMSTADPRTYDLIGFCVMVLQGAFVSWNLIANKHSIINWSFVPGNQFHVVKAPIHYENRTQILYPFNKHLLSKRNFVNSGIEYIKYTSKLLNCTTKMWFMKFHYFKHLRGRVCNEILMGHWIH